MDDQFQIVLPSNSSMKFFPDNKPNDFTTKLPLTYKLAGDYEAALIDLQYPYSDQNFQESVNVGVCVAVKGRRRESLDDFDKYIYRKLHDFSPLKFATRKRKVRASRAEIIKKATTAEYIMLPPNFESESEPECRLDDGTLDDWGIGELRPFNSSNWFHGSCDPGFEIEVDLNKINPDVEKEKIILTEDKLSVLTKPVSYARFSMAPHEYTSITDLCNKLNQKIKEVFEEIGCEHDPVKFSYNENQDRITGSSSGTAFWLFCDSKYLPNILGFVPPQSEETGYHNVMISQHHLGHQSPELDHPKVMYIYTDVVKYQTVGDMTTPLLAVIPVKDIDKQPAYWACQPPYYIPLSKSDFDTIRIRICTDTGKPFPLRKGKTICRLHFRRRTLL